MDRFKELSIDELKHLADNGTLEQRTCAFHEVLRRLENTQAHLNRVREQLWTSAVAEAWAECLTHRRSVLTGRCIP